MSLDSPTALPAGTRLGPYQITALVGRGGMGEVYRARDARLSRDVAIKVLPASDAGDPARRARFEREALAISQLNHPHICAVHDFGEVGGVIYLVMEYVEGESLDKILRRGPLAVDQAITWAIQMASAVDAAHSRGIVHRDLKPANVMVGTAGVKLLDFGLAKWQDDTLEPSTAPPTVTLTGEQTILGTTRYMAPEQLDARPVDQRTDIFALGATLYEMLTGRPAFEGSTMASTTAAILTVDPPPPSALRREGLPPALDHVVARSLAKAPSDRWQTARDLQVELSWIQRGRTETTDRARQPTRRSALIAASTALVGAGWIGWSLRAALAPRDDGAAAFDLLPPHGQEFNPDYDVLSVSPDGQTIAVLAGPRGGPYGISMRAIRDREYQPVVDTEGASHLFWSPDSSSLAYFTQGELHRVNRQTKRHDRIAEVPEGAEGGTPTGMWPYPDVIAVQAPDGLRRIDPANSRITPTEQLAGQFGSVIGSDYYLAQYDSINGSPDPRVCIRSFSTPQIVPLPISSNAVYADDHVIFRIGDTLVAQSFDKFQLKLRGEPQQLVRPVEYDAWSGRSVFDVAANVLAYRGTSLPKLTSRDREGRPLPSTGELSRTCNPAMAPDASGRIAGDQLDLATGRWSVVVIDADGHAVRPTPGVRERFPVWSRDGQWIAYWSKLHPRQIRRIRTDGWGQDQLLFESDRSVPTVIPLDWSPDGRYLLLQTGLVGELRLLSLADRKMFQLVPEGTHVCSARFSPDGRFVAYCRVDWDRPSVWLTELPQSISFESLRTAAPPSQVCGAGTHPVWRSDQSELFYLTTGGTLMAVPVSGSPAVKFGEAQSLFSVDHGSYSNCLTAFAASADGQRFLITERSESTDQITVVLNWRRLVA